MAWWKRSKRTDKADEPAPVPQAPRSQADPEPEPTSARADWLAFIRPLAGDPDAACARLDAHLTAHAGDDVGPIPRYATAAYDCLEDTGDVTYLDWKDDPSDAADAAARLLNGRDPGSSIGPLPETPEDWFADEGDALTLPNSLNLVAAQIRGPWHPVLIPLNADGYALALVHADDADAMLAAANRLGRVEPDPQPFERVGVTVYTGASVDVAAIYRAAEAKE